MDKQLLNYLRDLKRYGIENDIPNVSEVGGRFLNMLVRLSRAKNILEIGCANGYSTIWLADAVQQNSGKVITIDFSKPSLESAKKNLADAGLSDVVEFHFGNALEVITNISNIHKFDFIFVDGEKRSYWDFWHAIKDRLADNAIVIFDDVMLFPEKTKHFMENIRNVLGFDQVVLPIDKNDGILMLLKT